MEGLLAGPRVAAVEHGAGGQVAAQAARPQHIDPPAAQRADAGVEQARDLVAVEGELVGHPQLEEPVEHRPRLGGGAQRDARVGAGALAEPVGGVGPRLGEQQGGVADVERVLLVVHLEDQPDGARHQLLLVGLDAQRDADQLRQRAACAARRCWAMRRCNRSSNPSPRILRDGATCRSGRGAGAPGALRGIVSTTASSAVPDQLLGRLEVEVVVARARTPAGRAGPGPVIELADARGGLEAAGRDHLEAEQRGAGEQRDAGVRSSPPENARVSTGIAAFSGHTCGRGTRPHPPVRPPTAGRVGGEGHHPLARRTAGREGRRPGDGHEAHGGSTPLELRARHRPGDLPPADPPRESVVTFSDARRTVELPMRAALPVLTRAPRAGDDLHPSVGLLRGAALLGMQAGRGRQVRAGRRAATQLADHPARRRRPRPGRAAGRARAPTTGSTPSAAERARPPGARRRRRHDAAQRAAGRAGAGGLRSPRPRRRRRRRPQPPPTGFAERLQARIAAPQRRPPSRTCRSWSGSRCGSRPTRRSWSPARCGWCSRCTTSRTRCTSATPPLLFTEPGPTAEPRLRRAGPHPRRHRAARRGRGVAGARPVARAAGARRDHPRRRRARQPARGRRRRAARTAGVDVLWPRSLGRDLTATHRARPRRDPARGPAREEPLQDPLLGADTLFAFTWQLALHGDPLTAGGDGPAGRGRLARSSSCAAAGPWSTPRIARKARKRLVRTVKPAQAVAAALTGVVEVDRPAERRRTRPGRGRRLAAEGARAAARAPPPATRSSPRPGWRATPARLPAPRPDLAGRRSPRSGSAPAWPTTWGWARPSP